MLGSALPSVRCCKVKPRKGEAPFQATACGTAVLDDLPHNRILECAVTAEADLMVTGDRRFLKLRECEGIPIVSLADFLQMIPSE